MEIKHDPEIGSPAVATSDSASFQRTNHASAFQQFPDELLDLVFKTMDTTSAASLRHKPILKQAVTQSREACALVCRRWYNIVLPHLFRFVPTRDDVYEYVDQFYTTHPHLAHLVRSVYLSIDREVSIQPLDDLLRALPSLQSLNIRETCFSECRYPAQAPTGTYAIEELRYEYDTVIGGVGPSHIQGIACVLGLFSHIGRLETYQTDRQLEIDWESWF